jgi:hypothetical protein
MAIQIETHATHHPSEHSTAAFLLVIPSPAVIGAGIGMLTSHIVPGAIIGLGSGALLWGLLVALRRP